jgi:peptide deformylase
MAVLDIVLFPDEPLLKKAAPVDEIGPDMPQLVQDMIETMFEYDGVGLAAPQVGIAKRIFVLCEREGEPMCVINPVLSELEGREEGEEGCLSMPQVYAKVPRATRLRVRGFDEFGEPIDMVAEGFLARIIQHENDHLDGILFPDRLDIITREAVLREWNERRLQLLQETTRAAGKG